MLKNTGLFITNAYPPRQATLRLPVGMALQQNDFGLARFPLCHVLT